jgi:hypothetical protein
LIDSFSFPIALSLIGDGDDDIIYDNNGKKRDRPTVIYCPISGATLRHHWPRGAISTSSTWSAAAADYLNWKRVPPNMTPQTSDELVLSVAERLVIPNPNTQEEESHCLPACLMVSL